MMQRTVYLGLIAGLWAGNLEAWNRDKALAHLEQRQQAWADWKPAQKPGGPCISCHTGLSYLLAGDWAGGAQRSARQRELIQAVRTRAVAKPLPVTLPDPGAEAILNLLVLALERRSPAGALDPAESAALQRLWEVQIREGEERGSWSWVNAALEPMDSPDSTYLGTAFAAKALASFPMAPADRVQAAHDYLRRAAGRQPLHNRLAWAAFAAAKSERAPVLRDLWAAQGSDGGWTTNALGPWMERPDAPADRGSNAYATAWAAFTAQAAGVDCGDRRLQRALTWLSKRQDPGTGGWRSVSMNKVYPAGSIQEGFMSDAASGYAVAALARCGVN